ncbi:MAG: sugar phosphate isomerase/epimerase [Oscillospiraceae bacterium]|nr:sugar phosphate isomerase/epimerase [Oscillospiraceae bacterium]
MLGIGMFSWFSYNLPIEERLQLIKNAGFDAASLWWDGEDKHEQPDMARKIGLQIDNVHAQFMSPEFSPNGLWLEGIDGEDFQNMLISCVEDCHTHNISTVVIHLTSFKENVEVTDAGLERIKKIVDVAEQREVKLAFENLTSLEHLDAVFEKFPSSYVGFCYDSGHENWRHPNQDCLSRYGNRLFALHINDNFGDGDAHILPFDGTVDWNDKMQKLKQCKNVDYFTLEVDWDRKHEKCVIYHDLSAMNYLELAYKKAVRLLQL